MAGTARSNRLVVSLVALGVALTLAGQRADAQVVSFKVTGGGYADYIPIEPNDPVFHDAFGTATHLGNYSCTGKVQLDAFISPTTANFSSAVPCVFTAADGSKLAFHYGRDDLDAEFPGIVELFPTGDGRVIAVWLAEFNPIPGLCTGRFARIKAGSFMMLAITEPFVLGAKDPVAYWWEGEGWIEYGP